MLKEIILISIILIGIIISSYGLYLALATENKCDAMREYINELESTERMNIKLL